MITPQTGWFGPENMRASDEAQIPAPVGAHCTICREAVTAVDMGTVSALGTRHYECMLLGANATTFKPRAS